MDKGNKIHTLEDALFSKVRFSIPEDTVRTILIERALDGNMAYVDANPTDVRLAYADILKWLVLGPSKMNNTSDSDNGWSHTEGGFEISERDRTELKAEANAIYAELEPSSMLKKKSSFRITSHGVKRADFSAFGCPLPHIIK
nr:MAG TPA: hypothetical protein [Bacteriophage sp.]DAO73877.1 MAG TPA: hypothetical protein [Caudoviricetes sp.]